MSAIKIERSFGLHKHDHTSIVTHADIEIIQKIQSKHGTENSDFEFTPMMDMIMAIFRHANLTSEMDSPENGLSKSSGGATDGFEMQDNNLRVTIHLLSWKIICKSASRGRIAQEAACTLFTNEQIIYESKCGKGAQEAAFAMLDLVRSYSWVAKVVLVLAAFAMSYCLFWTNAKSNFDSLLAQPVCLFLHPPCLLGETYFKKLHFESIKKLVEEMLAVANLMVDLNELTKENKNQFDSSTTAALQYGVYQIITSVYACFSYNMNLVEIDAECTSWVGEIKLIKYYTDKLTDVYGYLFQLYYQEKGYWDLERKFKMQYQSVKDLISTFYKIEDPKQCLRTVRGEDNLDKLNGNRVAFFISHWNVNMECFKFLEQTYKENQKVEILWIPITEEWSSYNQISFEKVYASMHWSSLWDPSSVHLAFLRYIRQHCQFYRKPILVFLDENLRVINIDALPTVEFWGAFITPHDEDEILREIYAKPIWQLLHEVQKNLQQLVEGNLVCFYGGHDYDWINSFGKQMAAIKTQCVEKFKMEIIYIGTRKAKTKLDKLIQICRLSKGTTQSWEPDTINTFWRRQKYLYHQRTNCTVEFLEDAIMKELMTISSYDYTEDGWAIMFGGSSDNKFISSGQQLMQCLTSFESWASDIKVPADFVLKLNDYLHESHTEEHCTNLIVPATAINTHVVVRCFICKRRMEKSFLFKCCTK